MENFLLKWIEKYKPSPVMHDRHKTARAIKPGDVMFAVYMRHKMAAFSTTIIEFTNKTWIFLGLFYALSSIFFYKVTFTNSNFGAQYFVDTLFACACALLVIFLLILRQRFNAYVSGRLDAGPHESFITDAGMIFFLQSFMFTLHFYFAYAIMTEHDLEVLWVAILWFFAMISVTRLTGAFMVYAMSLPPYLDKTDVRSLIISKAIHRNFQEKLEAENAKSKYKKESRANDALAQLKADNSSASCCGLFANPRPHDEHLMKQSDESDEELLELVKQEDYFLAKATEAKEARIRKQAEEGDSIPALVSVASRVCLVFCMCQKLGSPLYRPPWPATPCL